VNGHESEGRNQVFVSYYHHDSVDQARTIVRYIQRWFGDGTAFLDEQSLRPGSQLGDELSAAIRNCRVFVALVGTQWEADDDGPDWVIEELREAARHQRAVIPIFLEPKGTPSSGLARAQWQARMESHAELRDYTHLVGIEIDHSDGQDVLEGLDHLHLALSRGNVVPRPPPENIQPTPHVFLLVLAGTVPEGANSGERRYLQILARALLGILVERLVGSVKIQFWSDGQTAGRNAHGDIERLPIREVVLERYLKGRDVDPRIGDSWLRLEQMDRCEIDTTSRGWREVGHVLRTCASSALLTFGASPGGLFSRVSPRAVAWFGMPSIGITPSMERYTDVVDGGTGTWDRAVIAQSAWSVHRVNFHIRTLERAGQLSDVDVQDVSRDTSRFLRNFAWAPSATPSDLRIRRFRFRLALLLLGGVAASVVGWFVWPRPEPRLANVTTLSMCGSSTVGRQLAPALRRAFEPSDVLTKRLRAASGPTAGQSPYRIDIVPTETLRGVMTWSGGNCDIVMASDHLSASVLDAATKSRGDEAELVSYDLGSSALTVVSPPNALQAVTVEGLGMLYDGSFADWEAACASEHLRCKAGLEGPIRTLHNPPDSGTFAAFTRLTGTHDCVSADCRHVPASDVPKALEPGTIGYIDASQATTASVIGVEILHEPGGASWHAEPWLVRARIYPLSRPLALYAADDRSDSLEAALQREFVAFVNAPAATHIVRDMHLVEPTVLDTTPGISTRFFLAHEGVRQDPALGRFLELPPAVETPDLSGWTILMTFPRFDDRSAKLGQAAKGEVERAAAWVAGNRDTVEEVALAGFTAPERYPAGRGARLSLARARAVEAKLREAVGSEMTITVQGFGDRFPIRTGTSSEDQEVNRRVEIWVRRR